MILRRRSEVRVVPVSGKADCCALGVHDLEDRTLILSVDANFAGTSYDTRGIVEGAGDPERSGITDVCRRTITTRTSPEQQSEHDESPPAHALV
jgi:hypothetical protein